VPSCLKYGSEKSLSREACLDKKLRNKKTVRQPVCCSQAAEASASELTSFANSVFSNHVCNGANNKRGWRVAQRMT
jgi:hypothetical protein